MTAGRAHLDGERLTALMDGDADPIDEAHAASCVECGARLAAWQGAAAMVSALPEPEPDAGERREATIAAALAEASDGAVVTALEGRRRVPVGWRVPVRRRVPVGLGPRLLAVAAALLLVGGLAFGLTRTHHASPAHIDASAPPAPSAAPLRSASGASGGTSGTGGSGGVSGASADGATVAPASSTRDLGSFQSMSDLVPALRRALVAQSKAAPTAASRFSAGQTASGTVSTLRPSTPLVCSAPAGSDALVPRGTAPVFESEVIYRSMASQVFVFDAAIGHIAVVVTSRGCAMEARASF